MKEVIQTGIFLVIASAAFFIGEVHLGLLPQMLEAFGVEYRVAQYAPALMALAPFVAVFVAGVLTNEKALIITPLLLCVGVVTALVPMLGIKEIPQVSSLAQIYVPSAIVAIIGSFVLTNNFDMWRVRQGRIGMFWRVAFALEIVNVSMYLFLTLSGMIIWGIIPIGLPILAVAGVVAYFTLNTFSDRAEGFRLAAEELHQKAKRLPGLETVAEGRKEAIDKLLASHKELGEKNTALLTENAHLKGRVEELSAVRLQLDAALHPKAPAAVVAVLPPQGGSGDAPAESRQAQAA